MSYRIVSAELVSDTSVRLGMDRPIDRDKTTGDLIFSEVTHLVIDYVGWDGDHQRTVLRYFDEEQVRESLAAVDK
jgi:hypothetical protein